MLRARGLDPLSLALQPFPGGFELIVLFVFCKLEDDLELRGSFSSKWEDKARMMYALGDSVPSIPL
jgi:hypothetical protein